MPYLLASSSKGEPLRVGGPNYFDVRNDRRIVGAEVANDLAGRFLDHLELRVGGFFRDVDLEREAAVRRIEELRELVLFSQHEACRGNDKKEEQGRWRSHRLRCLPDASARSNSAALNIGSRLLVQQLGRNFPAVLGELPQHFFVQPHIHGGRVVLVPGVMQIVGEFLARGQAAVHAHEFHQVHDGMFPIELLRVLGRKLVEDRGDVDLLCGRARGKGRGLSGAGARRGGAGLARSARAGRRSRSRGGGSVTENF